MHEFLRREGPRIATEAMCWEQIGRYEASALAIDLSSVGLRIERPYVGGYTRRTVSLQIEVPGMDEIMWARGDAVYDVVVPEVGPLGGAMGLVRRTGYRIIAATQRELRMLKEVVFETYRSGAMLGA